MAKKGNMDIDKKDFEFDDEMFPLDDSVYDDDNLGGFKFDPNDNSGPGGVKGFFINTMKSVKGIGVDFIDDFLPEAVSLSDDIKMAAGDAKDKFVEMKDKAFAKMSDFKSSANKDSTNKVKGEVKSGFKGIFDNIKKGKFYTSNRDQKIDMSAFMGDGNDNDSEGSGEPEDTSGRMTTSFNYKKKRRRTSPNIIVNNDNSSTIRAMGEIQEASAIANATIQTKLANAQIKNNNQNYYETLKVLNNIADNVYGISDFLTHYGKTNLKAQLEFDSKALAFLTDQRAILKDILVANNRAIGIKEKEEAEEKEGGSLFHGGMFDMSKYIKNIGKNAKDMFLSTQLGSSLEMGSMATSMMGSDSGFKMDPKQLFGSMIKSGIMGSILGEKNKNKLNRLNQLYGNAGGFLVSTMNKFKDSKNPFLNFIGNFLGTDKGITKTIDLNKEDLDAQSPLDVRTKETINETIPGYLAQITAALTGNKLTYYNHQSKQFETFESIEKKYKQTQEATLAGNVDFSTTMDLLEENVGKGATKSLTKEILKKSIDKFKENVLESKTAVSPSMLLEDGDYRNKMFRGIEGIAGDQSKKVMDLIGQKLMEMEMQDNGRALMDFNNSILSVSNQLEENSRAFKERSIKTGGLTAIAQINEKERLAELKYELEHSAKLNKDLNKEGSSRAQSARINYLRTKAQMNYEQLGKVDMLGTSGIDTGTGLSEGAYNKINSIYELLAGGIAVYSVTDPTAYNKRMSELSSISSSIAAAKTAKEKKEQKEIDFENEIRDESLKGSVELAKLQKQAKLAQAARFEGSFIGRLVQSLGGDRLINKVIDIGSAPLSMLSPGVKEFIEEGSAGDQKELEAARELAAKKKAEQKEIASAGLQKAKERGGFFGRLATTAENIYGSAKNKMGKNKAKADAWMAKKLEEQKKKEVAANKKREKNGGLLYRASGWFAQDAKTRAQFGTFGAKRGINIYIDPDYYESLSEQSRVKINNLIQKSGATIKFNLNEDTDIAFAKSFSEDDQKTIDTYGTYVVKASLANLKQLGGVLGNASFIAENKIKRMNKRAIAENKSITDYNERDEEINQMSVQKFDFKAIDDKKKKGRSSNKDRKELAENIKNAVGGKTATGSEVAYKYKLLAQIKNPSTAGKIFLRKGIEDEIDQLLASGDKDAIFAFANKIKSKNEGATIIDQRKKLSARNESALAHLDPKFAARMNAFLNDPALINSGVSIKDAARSPLLQFALYSKGRVDPAITDELLKYAGISEGINYYPESIRTLMGPDGITVRSISSNHLTGRAVDINNGSMSWSKLGAIAKNYGIKWAGDADKPHFEFDPNFKDGEFNVGVSVGPMEKAGISKESMVKVKKSRASTTTSGSPIELYQHDPVDTEVTGTPDAATKLPKTQIGMLQAIYGKVSQIADNTTKIGFGIGIPGKVGKGLFGKIGDTAKNFAKNTYGFAKDAILGKEGEDGKRSGGLLGAAKKVSDKALDLGGKALDKFKDITKNAFGLAKDIIFGKEGEDGKRSGGLFDSAKGLGKSIWGAGKGLFKAIFNKGKDVAGDIKEKGSEAVEAAKKFLIDKKIIKKEDAENLDNKATLELAIKNGFSGEKSEATSEKKLFEGTWFGGLIEKVKGVSDSLRGATANGKEIAADKVEKAKAFLLEKKVLGKRALNKLPSAEVIKLAAQHGFDVGKDKIGQGISFAKDAILGKEGEDGKRSGGLLGFAKSAVTGAAGFVGGLFGGKKIKTNKKLFSKLDEIIDAIYDVNGMERPNGKRSANVESADQEDIEDESAEETTSGKKKKKKKGIFKRIGGAIKRGLGAVGHGAWDLAKKGAKGIWGLAKDGAKGAWQGLKYVGGLAKDGAIGMAHGIGNAATATKDFIKSHTLKGMEVEDIIEKYNLEEDFNLSAEEIKERITKEELIDYVKDKKKEKRKKILEKLASGAKKVIKAPFSLAAKIGSGAWNLAKRAGGALMNFGKNAKDKIKESGIFGKVKDKLGRGATAIGKGLKGIPGKIDGLFGGAVAGVKGLFGGDGFKSMVIEKLGNIDNTLMAIGMKLGAIQGAQKQPNKMLDMMTDLFGPRQTGTEASVAHREGSFEDQKADLEKKESIERDRQKTEALTGIAAVLGTTKSAAVAANETSSPEPNIASMMMANYQNAEKQNELLGDIKKKAGTGGGGRGGSILEHFAGGGGRLAGGLKVAGAGAAIAGAAAGAAMIAKQVHNKVKSVKADWKGSTVREKVGSVFGAGGSGNYDAEGNRITDKGQKAGQGFGVNQLVHIATFAKGVSKLPAIFAKFSGLVQKIFTNPKIAKKIGGPKAAKKVADIFLKSMNKTLSKGGNKLIMKVGNKIAGACAKMAQPVGWGMMVAQLAWDIGSGMQEAPRYFKMGKGVKPTIAMRITAGLAKALSGNLTFGLIPPETIANLIFSKIGNDATKEQMKAAEEFDKKRAAIMEVEYDRLVEFETLTISEMLFGGKKKRATILGFMKGKKDKDGQERFETWFEKVYQPLDSIYKDMIKQYGGKVVKKIDPEDVAMMDKQTEFREAYLKAAQEYMNKNKLQGLGPLAKKENDEEKSEAKAVEENEQEQAEEEKKEFDKEIEDEAEVEGTAVPAGEDEESTGEGGPNVSASAGDVGAEATAATDGAKISVSEQQPSLNKNAKFTPGTTEQLTAKVVASKNGISQTPIEDHAYKVPKRNGVTYQDLYEGKPVATRGKGSAKYRFDQKLQAYVPIEDNFTRSYGTDISQLNWYDANGFPINKAGENAQADGINFKKLNDRNYIRQWTAFAKSNESATRKLDRMTMLRNGVKNVAKRSLLGKIGGGIFKGVKKLVSKLSGTKVGQAIGRAGSALFKKLRSPIDAIAAFVSNRKATEQEISSKFSDPASEKDVISLQSKIVDKNALGQQTSAANLSPEFAERVEAFLKDPRVQGHGVKIREGYRSPATQLAYYSKGRASPATTDKLMKMAGFKDGINFWSPSFQKPGDYITWTLASNHFNGTAVDLEPGDLGYDTLGKIAQEYGIDWGGTWSTPDKPHFEMGPANFRPKNQLVSGSTTEAQAAQADTINYDKMLNPAIRRKVVAGAVSKAARTAFNPKPFDSAHIASLSKRIGAGVRNRLSGNGLGGVSTADPNNSIVTSNLVLSKFDELLKTSTEGVDIMRDLYNEQKRHNKAEEAYLKNIIQGLAALGGIVASANAGGYSSAGSSNSITKGLFDQIAKGV